MVYPPTTLLQDAAVLLFRAKHAEAKGEGSADGGWTVARRCEATAGSAERLVWAEERPGAHVARAVLGAAREQATTERRERTDLEASAEENEWITQSWRKFSATDAHCVSLSSCHTP